ncbi:conserved hypothetical protein [uncultured delta proteobacterium]|uniref:4Fe-4S ferredoxin-type domain-containing protein n=1 Tax=uncultured delta proteobacterium TaxID=34034 RepID=A0A212KEK2_9DELT|nr:conserved hypothetical protein [uncultured delta proteobacterium]
MRTIRLGSTGLQVTGVSFGALPIQRISLDEAVRILRRALEAGVNFYDTAHVYSDSEEKMGVAFAGLRDNIIIATKSMSGTGAEVAKDIDTSLAKLKTDYIDVLQIHNPSTVPVPDDGTGRYEAMLAAKQAGKIRHIGLTNHRIERAEAAADSGLYEVIQYPFSLLSSLKEQDFARRCKDLDIGFIAMKALSGGLVRHIPAAYAFMRRFENVVPIWGIQRMEELEEFLALEANPPAWDATMQAQVEEERNALGKNFCRGCGYCLPCPVGIPIPMLARMRLFLERAVWRKEITPEAQAKNAKADECINCGDCASRCPYELDPAALVKENYAYYKAFVAEKKASGAI